MKQIITNGNITNYKIISLKKMSPRTIGWEFLDYGIQIWRPAKPPNIRLRQAFQSISQFPGFYLNVFLYKNFQLRIIEYVKSHNKTFQVKNHQTIPIPSSIICSSFFFSVTFNDFQNVTKIYGATII
jgi:hypothetical protein